MKLSTPVQILSLAAPLLVVACVEEEHANQTFAVQGDRGGCIESARLQRAGLHIGDDNVRDHRDEIVEEGREFFRDRKLHGLGANGRACADCHHANENFQLTPANAAARLAALEECRSVDPDADDPLFRPIDADDFRINGSSASVFDNLVQNGLIRVTIPLPANVKLVDPASCNTGGVPAPCDTATSYAVTSETVADVWRSVPSVIGVAISGPDGLAPVWARGPNTTGGYQLDGRIDTLQNQALGALRNHAQAQTDPAQSDLDAVAAFQLTIDAPADPVLEPGSLEAQGRTVFARACANCHGGPAFATPGFGPDDSQVRQPNLAAGTGVKRYHDITTTCPRPVDTATPKRWDFAGAATAAGEIPPCGPGSSAKNARTYEITFADGFKLRRTTSDPGRMLLTGFVFSAAAPPPGGTCAHPPCGGGPGDDFQKFDPAPLRGISRTAPYFHNNSAATLEAVVIHYEEFYKRVNAINPPSTALTPSIMTSGTISCSDPRCTGGFSCSQDGLCRDRPNVPSERAALVAYLKTL